MKLADHVQLIKKLIEKSFDKEFSKLGILPTEKKDINILPECQINKRCKFEAILKSHEEEIGSYAKGRERAIEELTFTLFNRIAAIKVMEAKELFPPIITKSEEHGNRSFGHKVWLEENPHMRSAEFEGIRDYIIYAFNHLGETLPLYNKNYPYALLPDIIALNDIIDKFNSVERDNDIDNLIWSNDDILGWLYESYNNDKKQQLKDVGDKTEYDKVSIQSQVYTPRWVVEFLVNNSLGKLYMEMYPDSQIGLKFKIANLDDGVRKSPKQITEFKSVDPACGSGNFLLYTFDLLYELYQDQIDNYGLDMDEGNIAKSIIENNIYGIDLDDRAIQLAQLGLYIKAKTKKRNIKNLNFNVVSSAFFLPNFEDVKPIFNNQDFVYSDQMDIIQNIWNDLKDAYKFGSLIRLKEQFDNKIKNLTDKYNREGAIQQNIFEINTIQQHIKFEGDFFENLEKAVNAYAKSSTNDFLCKKTSDAIKFLKILTMKFDIATANPPYTDSAAFGSDLKTFIDNNFKKIQNFSTNLYSVFIKRCFELTNNNGKMALVHPPTFMYIKTFEDVRKFILDNVTISLFVEWGYLGMFNPSARVDSAMYIFDKSKPQTKSTFIKLNDLYEGKRYKELKNIYDALLNNSKNPRLFKIEQNSLKEIKSYPYIYWISNEFRHKISSDPIDKILKVRQGIATGNNNRCLRFWYEILENKNSDMKDWKLYAKGGPFQKWFGNMWLIINFDVTSKQYLSTHGNTLPSKECYFQEGITYTASGSKGASFRYLQEGCLFDVGGSCIFPDKYKNIYYYISFMNSQLASYILNECLNPTANKQVGDMKRIPFVIPNKEQELLIEKLAKKNISLTKEIKSYIVYEYIFIKNPLNFSNELLLTKRLKEFYDYENYLNIKILINEAIIDSIIYDIYALSDIDKQMVVSTVGESITSLPCSEEAKNSFIALLDSNSDSEILDYISNIETQELSSQKKQNIISDFGSLYQDTNELYSFSLSHKINPIDIWYLFKGNNILPTLRTKDVTMEFLVDIIRTLLHEDDDGIIPLTKNVGEEYLYDRIQNKMYDLGFSDAQFSSLDSLLGKNLKSYLEDNFFADFSNHLNLFQNLPKTPFIWHITSGKEKAFECVISIYKWSRDNLMRLRSVYVEHRERTLKNRQMDLGGNNSAQAQEEKEQIKLQLEELQTFKVKIDDLLASGYNPKLDDGVGKNIAPLQKRGMLAYDVLNAGQLKKYLNADW